MIRPRSRERLAWAIATLLGIGILAVSIRQVSSPEANPRVARFAVAAPAGTSLPPAAPFAPEISPDGTRLVFHIVRGGERLLAIRPIDALEAQILVGTEGAAFPFWSPDSRVIAFFADGKLKRMNVAGGPIQVICEAPSGLGGTWSRDGVIVFLSAGDLHTVAAAAGSQPTTLTSLRRDERFQNRPRFLPDGRRFLYFVEPDAIYLASLDGGDPTRLPANANAAVYAPPGYLVLRQGRTLVAQRFESDLSKPLGDPMLVAEEVPLDRWWWLRPGSRVVLGIRQRGVGVRDDSRDGSQAGMVRSGRPTSRHRRTVPLCGLYWRGAFARRDAARDVGRTGPDSNSEIWLFDLARGQPTQLTFSAGADRRPIWSPDSQRLAVRVQTPGSNGLLREGCRGRTAGGIAASFTKCPEARLAIGLVIQRYRLCQRERPGE